MTRPMDNLTKEQALPFWRGDILFASFMFIAACVAFWFASRESGLMLHGYGWPTAIFFFAFGIFTITVGYPHPGFGHVSFDRVAQVASILVLGPLDAAWINGLASLIYPWHRLFNNVPLRTVVVASLHNAGMMTLVVLGCGLLYTYLGGPIPLEYLTLSTAGLLLLLMLSMQLVNDLSMLVLMYLRGANISRLLSVFSTGVELASCLIAIVVALVFVRLETQVFAVLLVVLCLGMLVLKNYAQMRQHLEYLVDKRTEELRLKTIELELQATHDKLTGLFNRRYADDYLQREIEASRRHDREFTVALADIDHFKQINDRFSHAVGDRVLERISRILVERCRKTDVVARYGGEEFLLCFPDTSSEFAEQICGQIRKAVERADWAEIVGDDNSNFRITISFGIAEVSDDSRRTSILSDADDRLYMA
ncbi:MAG: GGDEF domain-containing protein, partial [Woeseiaceae bacterium]